MKSLFYFLPLLLFCFINPSSLLASDDCKEPSGLKVEKLSNGSVKLSWSSVNNAKGYKLEIEDANNNPHDFEFETTTSHNYYLANSLRAKGSYKYKVRTICTDDKSDWTENFYFTIDADNSSGNHNNNGNNNSGACDIPSGLTISNVTDNSVTVSWNAVEGAINYEVEIEDGDNTPAFNFNQITNMTTLTVFGLAPGGQYKAKVKSKCSNDNSEYTQWVFFNSTQDNGGGNDPNGNNGNNNSGACDIPSGLTISNVTDNSATVSWNAVEGAINYEVEIEDGDNTPAFNFNQITNMTTLTVSGLAPGGHYKAKVKSKCSNDNSEYTQWVFFTTGQGPTGSDSTAVDTTGNASCVAPTGLVVTNITDSSAVVSWMKPEGVSLVEVEAEEASDSTSDYIFKLLTNQSAMALIGLNKGGTYKVKVKSKCSNDNSEYTQWVFFTTGGQPSSGDTTVIDTTGAFCVVPMNLQVSEINTTSARLSWDAIPGVANYELEVEDDENTPPFDFNIITSDTSVVITGLSPNGQYQWKVKSKCTNGFNSEYSDWDFFQTPSNELRAENQNAGSSGLLQQVEAISVFPNPANQEFRIELPQENDLLKLTVRIFDQRGQLVWQEENIPADVFPKTLPIANFENGMYHISIQTRLGVKTTKLMVFH